MTKGFLTIAAVLALVLLFAAAAVPETEPIIAPELTVSAQIPTARYRLTADERELICEVVMAESGIEPFDGKMAVSQCILNACEKTGKRPVEIVAEYGYTDRRVEPNAETREAVAAVFDAGETATDREILYFYAPALCQSLWHESQTYVCTIGGHRFFGEAGAPVPDRPDV
jgi:spore germination cell wall hydrolase CwlJ-like protein